MQYEILTQLPIQEFLAEVFRESPKDCTWRKVSSWLETRYASRQIAEMYLKLHEQLVSLTDYRGESLEADQLRDVMDIFWYATDDYQMIEDTLKERHFMK
jgi:hypothetical protein